MFYCYKVIKVLNRLSPYTERCILSLETCQQKTGFIVLLRVRENTLLGTGGVGVGSK